MDFTESVLRIIELAQLVDSPVADPLKNTRFAGIIRVTSREDREIQARQAIRSHLEACSKKMLYGLVALTYMGRENAQIKMTDGTFLKALHKWQKDVRDRTELLHLLTGKGLQLAKYLNDGMKRARRFEVDLDITMVEFGLKRATNAAK